MYVIDSINNIPVYVDKLQLLSYPVDDFFFWFTGLELLLAGDGLLVRGTDVRNAPAM